MPNYAEADAAVSLSYTSVIMPEGPHRYIGRVPALGDDCSVTETTLATTRSSLERALRNELTIRLLQGNPLPTNLLGKQYEWAMADTITPESTSDIIVEHVEISVATQ